MLEIYWQGRIRTDKVEWRLQPDSEIQLPVELENKREKIWQKILDQFPKAYDGMLVKLNAFSLQDTQFTLNLSPIRFSRVQTLLQAKLHLEPYGVVGVQAIILSPDGRYILYGERSKDVMHCPKFLGPPGGMLSVDDVRQPFWKACMREINEEAHVQLQPAHYLIAILGDLYTTVGTVMLILTYTEEEPDLNQPVAGNEEWSNSELHWHPVETLLRLDETRILEGLVFAKADWEQRKKSGESVIWESVC